jgi:anti-sigma-K factor RskA
MSAGYRGHDLIEELVVADALGGLDEAGRRNLDRELAMHGPDCAQCRALVAEYREVAGRLAFALDPAPLSAGAEDRLLEAAREARPRSAPGGVGSRGRLASVRPGRRSGSEGSARRWVATAAVAAGLAVLGGFAGFRLAPKSGDLRAVAFAPQGGQQLAVIYEPGASHAFVVGANLPAPPAGKTYELWYQPATGAPMRPAGTFEPTDGRVVARADVGTEFVALAVSVEPDGGSPHPTTDPVFVATV